MQKQTNNIFQKYQERGTHDSLHFNLQGQINAQQFVQYLSVRQKQEIQKKSKSIWMHLNEQNLNLCGDLIKIGYKIHHGLEDKIKLYKWIETTEDLVPPYSMIYLGCGGILIDENEILLVQESNGPRKDQWGISGGLLNRGEFVSQGVEREVWEQTGLKTKFQYIVYFRQVDKYIHNSTDVFFACYLKLAQGVTRQCISLCKQQISGHRWVPLNQLQQFVLNNKFGGTQKYVMELIIDLHKKGYDFDKNRPIVSTQGIITTNGVERKRVEHQVINI